ncbi:Gfo/Idh/MocA family protein [Pacificoceanicola onchidii]|uniref:Gfo/Idh/MocA family protein n=1 Tax=Pacificoceanicola onchidii TaxID=2562685 RepID=UPI0010A4EFC4|nr:Gfo/Idh/MocA family oxidoreductase [Pacificoceanicola onchidii]
MLLPEKLDFEGPFPRLARRLRLGVVGGGRISGMQATAARMTDRWEVVAGAFSSDPARAKASAPEWYLPEDRCYASFAQMAAAEAAREDGVDAVMITTPNHLHFDCAKAFLEAGIDVLCDKPLTNEVAEAEALVALTHETGCVFGVSYVMSCFPMIRQAREIVAGGGIGKINQIHVEFMQDWMTPEEVADAPHVKWRLDPAKSGKTSCVGDIGTHAAHLASFVSHLDLTELRAEFHVCGAPKPLEDTVFAWTRHGDVPGTLMATRLAPGNRGGLRLRIYGSEGGLEWDLEDCDRLKFNRFGEPDRVISRGHGHGVSLATERLVRTARGFPEGIIEAWGNLYTEFAMAVAARKDGRELPDGWLGMPRVTDGAEGVRFIDACVRSNSRSASWVSL